MDVRYVNPFVKSVCDTFETMCNLQVLIGRPQLKTGEDPASDVSSIIGFAGDAAGSIVFHFPFDTASKIATSFAGVQMTPDHADFADALGELANMVAGGAKAQFEGLDIAVALPNVIVGRDHHLSASRTTPRIVIPCTTDAGGFGVELGMELGKPARVRQAAATTGVQG